MDGVFLGDRADETVFSSLLEAQEKCLEIGEGCGGVLWKGSQADGSYTLHKPSKVREARSEDEIKSEPVAFVKYKVNNKPKSNWYRNKFDASAHDRKEEGNRILTLS